MSLPILNIPQHASPEALVRFFHQTERHWTEHLAEPVQLNSGTAFANAALANVRDANRVLDAAVEQGSSPDDALHEVAEHFAEQGTRCWSWIVNPSAGPEQTTPLVQRLLDEGFVRRETQILYLQRMPASVVREVAGLTIIPQRASFRHTRELSEEAASSWNEPQLAEAAMMHLDDPSWDALLAMRDGVAVGKVGVLAVGEIGRIEDLYVSQAHRREGIGRTLMSRALEICARSLFKHIFVSCTVENAAANALYAQLGFREVGRLVSYHSPE